MVVAAKGWDERLLAPILRKLDPAVVFAADREAFLALPFTRGSFAAGDHLVREGEAVAHCHILASGFAHRYKLVADGGRQIIAVQLAGDFLDLQNTLFGAATHNIQMLTAGELILVPKAALEDVCARRPGLQRALWLDTLIDASIFSEWIANVGRRDARTRIAHLLCEFAVRLKAAGLLEGNSFTLPMSQEHIADATGLTPVHVNRTLMSLRSSGLIASHRRLIIINDWESLAAAADFHPGYLNPAAGRNHLPPSLSSRRTELAGGGASVDIGGCIGLG
jgi:CRP-like cAMP-binding protein